MVDRLKGRLKDKEQEIEKLHKSNEMLKNVLERQVPYCFFIYLFKNLRICTITFGWFTWYRFTFMYIEDDITTTIPFWKMWADYSV